MVRLSSIIPSVNNSKRRRPILLILLVTLLLVVGYLGIIGWRLYRIARSVQATQTDLETLTTNGLANADPAAVSQLVRDVRTDVVDLQSTVDPLLWLTPYLDWLPRVGPLMPEARDYLTLADAGTRSAEQLAPTIEAGLRSLQSGDDLISAGVGLLADAAPTLGEIEPDVKTIQSVWGDLESKEALPWAVRQYIPQIDAYLPLADDGIEAAQVLPELVGVDGEKQYLMLIQNDDERRATGGFVSSIGTVRVANGELISLEFSSSDGDFQWLLENSGLFDWPPEPLTRYMNLQYFLYRDANYWPDFPTSAEKILELYKVEYADSPDFDGLIAIDQRFVSILLQGTGSIYVPELDQTVSSDNVIDVMRSAWNPTETVTGEWHADRKSFVGEVAKAIQERVLNDPTQLDMLAMGNAVFEAFETRHLQIYATDPAIARELAKLGWDGRAELPANSDYLMVVDTNMGFNKAHGMTSREIHYSADLQSNEANLAISYHHMAAERDIPCEPLTRYSGELRYDDMLGACLYNFVRVYPAAGSTLLSGSAHPTSGSITITGEPFDGQPYVIDEPPVHFANFFVVEPSTRLLNSYRYQLPESVTQDGVYHLLIQKQAGAGMDRVQVEVTVPTDATITSTTPPATVNGTIATFEFDFDRDVEIEVAYTP